MVFGSRPYGVGGSTPDHSVEALSIGAVTKAWTHRASPADRILTLERAAAIMAGLIQDHDDPDIGAWLNIGARLAQETALAIAKHTQRAR
jgi:hypothetical protein